MGRLIQWIRNHVANAEDPVSGRRLVTNLPLLLVDDEADHASVDTGEMILNPDGTPNEDHLPTAINHSIRQILHHFSRKAYVGYTATPFANIFIHERGTTNDLGPDLFPESFIVNLGSPSDYVGPTRVFGVRTPDGRHGSLPLIRTLDSMGTLGAVSAWMPPKHDCRHRPLHNDLDTIPPSLKDAIGSFLISCAVRKLRGQGDSHSSMLIHVTRFVNVQATVARQVEEYIKHLKQRFTRGIGHEEIFSRLREIWDQDFLTTTERILEEIQNPEERKTLGLAPLPTWPEVETTLRDLITDVRVRSINGTAGDILDYQENQATGLKVIAIGGDKLARGLTLEGLCCSFFLRASKMYDTLMQMGRWFGYRPGYLDLCRLYTTAELSEWFGHITDAANELREEFDLMVASKATPRIYGLKVQSHPVMMVTSRLKMRTARNLMLSFSGELLETVALYSNPEIIRKNSIAACNLFRQLGDKPIPPCQLRNGRKHQWKGFLWSAAPAANVIDFLCTYQTHPAHGLMKQVPGHLPSSEEYSAPGYCGNRSFLLR